MRVYIYQPGPGTRPTDCVVVHGTSPVTQTELLVGFKCVSVVGICVTLFITDTGIDLAVGVCEPGLIPVRGTVTGNVTLYKFTSLPFCEVSCWADCGNIRTGSSDDQEIQFPQWVPEGGNAGCSDEDDGLAFI